MEFHINNDLIKENDTTLSLDTVTDMKLKIFYCISLTQNKNFI